MASKGELPPQYYLRYPPCGFVEGPFDSYDKALEAADALLEHTSALSCEIWTRLFEVRHRQPGELEAGKVNEETLPSAGPGQDDMAFWWGIP